MKSRLRTEGSNIFLQSWNTSRRHQLEEEAVGRTW